MPENSDQIQEFENLLYLYYDKYIKTSREEWFQKIIATGTVLAESNQGRLVFKRFIVNCEPYLAEAYVKHLYAVLSSFGKKSIRHETVLMNTYPMRVEKAALLEDEMKHTSTMYENSRNGEERARLGKRLQYLHEQWLRAEKELHKPTPGDVYIIENRNVPVDTRGILLKTWEGDYGVRMLFRLENAHTSAGQETVWVSSKCVKRAN